MSAIEDVETQIKGVCIVKYDYGRNVATTPTSPQEASIATSRSRIHKKQTTVYDDIEHYRQTQILFDAAPMRLCAIHVCYVNPNMIKLFSIAVANIGKKSRSRMRFHHGNHMECQYELMTFGIIPQLLPIGMSGEVTLERHENWIKCRKLLDQQKMTMTRRTPTKRQPQQQEQEHHQLQQDPFLPGRVVSSSRSAYGDVDQKGLDPASVTEQYDRDLTSATLTDADRLPGVIVNVPNKMDVLMGRGNLGHFGNIRFRALIDENIHEYENLHRMGKTVLSEDIVKRIKGEAVGDDNKANMAMASYSTSNVTSGGRFLKRGKGCWIVMTDEEAREKVSHRFRNLRNKGGGSGASATMSVPLNAAGGKSNDNINKAPAFIGKRSRGGHQLQAPTAAAAFRIPDDTTNTTATSSNINSVSISSNAFLDDDALGFDFLDVRNINSDNVEIRNSVSVLSVGGDGSFRTNSLFQGCDDTNPIDNDKGCFGSINMLGNSNGQNRSNVLPRTDQQGRSSFLGNAFW